MNSHEEEQGIPYGRPAPATQTPGPFADRLAVLVRMVRNGAENFGGDEFKRGVAWQAEATIGALGDDPQVRAVGKLVEERDALRKALESIVAMCKDAEAGNWPAKPAVGAIHSTAIDAARIPAALAPFTGGPR